MKKNASEHYQEFLIQLRDEGLYAPAIENMGTWSRIIACSEGPPEKPTFGGKSYWLACVQDVWYVGTWAGLVYVLPSDYSLIKFTTEFFFTSGGIDDFPQELKEKSGLLLVSDDEVHRTLPDDRMDP